MIKAADVCVSCDDWVVVRQDHGGQPAARLHKLERRGVLRYLTRKNNSARLIMKVPYYILELISTYIVGHSLLYVMEMTHLHISRTVD